MSEPVANPCSWNKEWIDDFFSVTVPSVLPPEKVSQVTEEACIQVAKQVLSTSDVRVVDVPGAASFTLISFKAGKVVQFRIAALDDDILELAREIYGSLTPRIERLRRDGFPLPIYVADIASGTSLTQVYEDPLPIDRPFPIIMLPRTVVDFAKFIAMGAHYPLPASHMDEWKKTTLHFLDRLWDSEPLAKVAPELLPIFNDIKAHFHLLELLPCVLTHADLGTLNLFGNKQDGSLTAVIDWDHAVIRPFGTLIWSLYENFMACKPENEIVFYTHVLDDGRRAIGVLEDAFWTQLWRSLEGVLDPVAHGCAVRTAAAVGAVDRYLDLETLAEIEEAVEKKGVTDWRGINVHGFIRARGFIPALPRIEDGVLRFGQGWGGFVDMLQNE
ncbi:hypothetical protein ANO11243_009090 [Dothideomycetidae sp. 11243]|nr:hypothetical protein ANO11243_009090 [fungal sp. No.11243]